MAHISMHDFYIIFIDVERGYESACYKKILKCDNDVLISVIKQHSKQVS